MKLFKKKIKEDAFQVKVDEAIKCVKKLNETLEEYYKEDILFRNTIKRLKCE